MNLVSTLLFTLYVAGYGLGRLWVEALRIDPASELAGFRVNIWVSLLATGTSVAWLVQDRFRSAHQTVRS